MPSCGDRQRWKLPSALRALRAGRARDDECWCPHVRLWLPWSDCSWRRLESQNAPPRSPASTACLWQQSRWFKKKLQANNSDSLTWLLRPGEAFWIPSQTSVLSQQWLCSSKTISQCPSSRGQPGCSSAQWGVLLRHKTVTKHVVDWREARPRAPRCLQLLAGQLSAVCGCGASGLGRGQRAGKELHALFSCYIALTPYGRVFVQRS